MLHLSVFSSNCYFLSVVDIICFPKPPHQVAFDLRTYILTYIKWSTPLSSSLESVKKIFRILPVIGTNLSQVRNLLIPVSIAMIVMFAFMGSTSPVAINGISNVMFLGTVAFIFTIFLAFIFTKKKDVNDEQIRMYDSIVAAFHQVVEAIFISDSSGKIIYANPAGVKLFGFTEKELFSKSLKDFIVESSAGQLSQLENEVNLFLAECILKRKDNTSFYAEIRKQSLNDGKILEIVRDISNAKAEIQRTEDLIEELKYERDLLEEQSAELVYLSSQLEESERIQKELNAEKDKFFSIIAHDLKSPFAGIMGYTTLLLEEFELLNKHEMKEFITSLDKLSKNTFKLIENLLDWSRLQTGKMKCNPIKTQLYESILYATSLVSANAERKEIRIYNEVLETPFVNADERMLNSILENLLSNAIKFTPRGGTITISTKPINVFHEVTIKDTGVGMSPEVLEKIFRIDANYTTLGTEHEKGTGLGVILCKEMIERQGGAIKVESELNIGTKFSFILPMWSEPDEITNETKIN